MTKNRETQGRTVRVGRSAGSKNVFDFRQKQFLFPSSKIFFPQHMFSARLNWEAFALETFTKARPDRPGSTKPGPDRTASDCVRWT